MMPGERHRQFRRSPAPTFLEVVRSGSLITKTLLGVGACGNRSAISKDVWARLVRPHVRQRPWPLVFAHWWLGFMPRLSWPVYSRSG